MRREFILIVIVSALILGSYLTFLHYNPSSYTINAGGEAGGEVNPSGDIQVAKGSTRVFTVTPDPGYHIADVLVDGASVGPVNMYEFTDVGRGHTLIARFDADEYTLMVSVSGDGSVEIRPHKASYHLGEAVELTAVPGEGWFFTGWGGDSVGSENPLQVAVDGDKSVSAIFTKTGWTILATAGLGGEINPSGSIQVPVGGECAFTVTPDPGYIVSDVVVDGVSQGPIDNYMFTSVSVDHTIEAHFSPDSATVWTITASSGVGGSIEPEGHITVTDGGHQTFTITPNPDYIILDVVVDGSSVGAVSSYTFTEVAYSHTIEAAFKPIGAASGSLTTLWSYPGEFYDIQVSGSGEYLAASSAFIFHFFKADNPVPIWTSVSESEALYWGVAMSQDGEVAVVGDETGRMYYYAQSSKRKGYISSTWSTSSQGTGIRKGTLDVSQDGEVVAAAGVDGLIHVYRNCTDKTGRNLAADWVIGTSTSDIKLVLNSDGKYLVTCGRIEIEDHSHIIVTFIDTAAQEIQWRWVSPFPGTAYNIHLSGDGNVVALALSDDSSLYTGVYCWLNSASLHGNLVHSPSWMYTEKHSVEPNVAVSLDGKTVTLGASSDNTLHYWSGADTLGGGKSPPDWSESTAVKDVGVSDSGDLVIITSPADQEWRVQVYASDGYLLGMAQTLRLTGLSVSGNGRIIAVVEDQGMIRLYRYSP